MTAWLWAPLLLPPGLIALVLLLDAVDRRLTEHLVPRAAQRVPEAATPAVEEPDSPVGEQLHPAA
ncbi:hypothetical protein GCM10023200_27390 [Actinomycetospora chlora]|uniref:Uncharacterized protein n=1 Tax=Actinomycetospora chlora TaxID=663608 RepID=A0ABP9B5S3_9PSEU